MRISILLGAALALPALSPAQQNVRPGTDVVISNLGGVASPSGSHTGTFPNGLQSFGVSTTSCNRGTVNVPWFRDMNIDHPQIGMWIHREYQGRFEQVSLFKGVKHGFLSTNSPGCGSCPGGAGTSLVVGCSDTYGASLNYSHSWVAPPDEIDPWSGIWTSRGSHFDRGYPVQSPPFDADNVRSPINFPAGNEGYRNQAVDSGLNVTGATFWVSAYYNVIGEPDLNRDDNFSTHQLGATWSGSRWNWTTPNATQYPSAAIFRWTGATVTSANNANGIDGRFYVGVKVTGPVNGMYRYEYAIQNRDNNGEGAAFRIPFCSGATVTNVSFRDPDTESGNDWTITVGSNELVVSAPSNGTNNLSWGNLYNVGFDSDAAPANGLLSIDEAAVASGGNPSVDVSTSCPLNMRTVDLGPGCGSPTPPVLTANSQPTIPNGSFAMLNSNVAQGSSNVFVFSLASASVSLGGGCTLYIDGGGIFAGETATADAGGVATINFPIPASPALNGWDFTVQGVEVQNPSGAYGLLDLSNGLKIKLGDANPGCN